MGEGADQTTQQQGEILERVNSRRHLQGRVQRVLGRRGRALQALVVVELEFGAAFADERAVRDGGGVLDVGDGTSRLLEKQGDLFEREPVGVDREDVPPMSWTMMRAVLHGEKRAVSTVHGALPVEKARSEGRTRRGSTSAEGGIDFVSERSTCEAERRRGPKCTQPIEARATAARTNRHERDVSCLLECPGLERDTHS